MKSSFSGQSYTSSLSPEEIEQAVVAYVGRNQAKQRVSAIEFKFDALGFQELMTYILKRSRSCPFSEFSIN